MTGMEACKLEGRSRENGIEIDAMHFRGLLEKAWTEVGSLFSGSLQLIHRAFFWQFIGSSPTKYWCPEMFPLGYLQGLDFYYQFGF